MAPIFDSAWRQAALGGNAAAVQAFTDAVLGPLYSFCLYRVGRDHHLCEEVVQETLLRALRELANYDPRRGGNSIFPWLTGLARNEISRVLAQQVNGRSIQVLWAKIDNELQSVLARIDAEPFGDELLQRQETSELVNATMAQLPENYRQALEAKYLAGKSVRDLAAQWGSSEKAVESQLTRARKAFRATFLTLSREISHAAP